MQTQVLPYLRELVKDGHEIHLLTFERALPDERNDTRTDKEIEAALAAQGIRWHKLKYHKRLSVIATAYDIFSGALFIWRFLRREKVDILHGRVHVPTLMAALARKFSRHKPKLLFDIRGFFPEEYTDAGVWPEGGWLFRAAKRVERWLLKEADGFVVLTEKARATLFPESKTSGADKLGRHIEVIPCCVDLERFNNVSEKSRVEMRRRLKIDDRFVIAYVGSFGGWYLTDEMFEFFSAARESDRSVFVMVLTQRDKAMVKSRLIAAGFEESDFFIDSVMPSEIPQYLNAADVGLSFIKRCYSKQSSSPTKNAEYLASGLPVIANAGVGDVDAQIIEHNVGVIVERFDRDSYRDSIKQLKHLGNIRPRCRETAEVVFGLEIVGGTRYRRLYKRLLGKI